MLESILLAAGKRTVAAGNIGRSLVEVVMDPTPWDVLAIEAHVRDMLCQKYCLHTVGQRARHRAEQRFDAQRFSLDTYQAYLKARAL